MRVYEVALILVILGPISTVAATPTNSYEIQMFEEAVNFLQVEEKVNATTATVEASVFTPNVTTVGVSASVTSVEAIYSRQGLDLSQIAPIAVILILTGLTLLFIIRKRRELGSSSKALS